MRTRDLTVLLVVLGALVLTGLGKLDVTTLLALLSGAALPSPLERPAPADSGA